MSIFYPTQCLYKDFWSVPGATFEQRAPIYINCEVTKSRIGATIGAVIIIMIVVVMILIPVDKDWYKPVVIGVGLLLLVGNLISTLLAQRSAEVTIAQIRGEYETWKLGQPVEKQNLGEYSRYRAPLDVQLESANIIARPQRQQSQSSEFLTSGLGSFAGTLAAEYMKKR